MFNIAALVKAFVKYFVNVKVILVHGKDDFKFFPCTKMAERKEFLLGIGEFLHNKSYFNEVSIESLIKCKNNKRKCLLHCSNFCLSFASSLNPLLGGLGAQTTSSSHDQWKCINSTFMIPITEVITMIRLFLLQVLNDIVCCR